MPLIDALGEISKIDDHTLTMRFTSLTRIHPIGDRSNIPFFYLTMVGSAIGKAIHLYKKMPIADDLLTERHVTSIVQGLVCRAVFDCSIQPCILFFFTYMK